jgi:hypothetical protein
VVVKRKSVSPGAAAAGLACYSARRTRANEAGFTLLELMLVSALGVLMLGAAVYSLRDIGAAHARAEAYRLATSVRYLYEKSISDGLPYRLMVDMEEGSTWAERVEDEQACGVSLTLQEGSETRFKELARKALENKKKKEEERIEGGLPPPKPEVTYTDYADIAIKKHSFPKGVHVVDMATLSNKDPREAGKLAIHVFPHGVVERALVVIESDGGDEVYSVVTQPYGGTARVFPKEVDRKEVFR